MIGFTDCTKKAEGITITSLDDKRLVKIDPQEPGFFDAVLGVDSSNEAINKFIEAVAEVKKASLKPFYRAIYDPTELGNHRVAFQRGKKPAVGHSYNWWVDAASMMSPVEGRQWQLATEFQYYAFLVWLINQSENFELMLQLVVINSSALGHYYDSENSTKGEYVELTGSRCVDGVFDLANTTKILKFLQEENKGGFCLAGGDLSYDGYVCPLACLERITGVDDVNYGSVGLLVL